MRMTGKCFNDAGPEFGVKRMLCAWIAVMILAGLTGCAATSPVNGKKMVQYPRWTLSDWNPDKAVAHAERDLAAGTPKVFISGTFGAHAPGISPEQYPLVQSLPNVDAGIGCGIENQALREAQFKFAQRYNEHVIRKLMEGAGK